MNGAEKIAVERNEQLSKHNYTPEHDKSHKAGELVKAALYAITLQDDYKQDWQPFEHKIWDKSQEERYAIAGALLAAEIDRLQG